MNIPSLEKEEILKILNKIHSSNEVSQRLLSRHLNISLGKTNFLIRELIKKGLIKIKRFKNSHNKSSYLYHLTPEGLRHKTILTYRFLKRKIEEYNKLKQEIEELRHVLEEFSDRDSIIDKKIQI
jgi:EPS-associated MarR family transcriptional regulator